MLSKEKEGNEKSTVVLFRGVARNCYQTKKVASMEFMLCVTDTVPFHEFSLDAELNNYRNLCGIH